MAYTPWKASRDKAMDDRAVVVRRIEQAEDSQQAYCCMMEVPTPWPQALCRCRDWVTQNLGHYVEGYHLQLTNGDVIGHLYYALSERALIPYEVEAGVAVLYCEWIQRRFQKQGLRDRLFGAFLEDMRHDHVKGVLVESTVVEGQMHFQHYQKLGFTPVHESGHRKLMYLPVSQSRVSINPMEMRIKPREGTPVEVLILNGYMCPYEVSTQELVREVAREFGNRVAVREVWLTPESLSQYGAARGVFINGRQKLAGGESEEAVRQALLEEL
jgi:hypothetical protein